MGKRIWTNFTAFATDYLLVEIFFPVLPIVVELFMKSAFKSLGEFTLFEKALAISAMTVPMVSFIKASDRLMKSSYFILMIAGTILFAMSIFFAGPSGDAADLHRAYQFAGLGVLASIAIGTIYNLWRVFADAQAETPQSTISVATPGG